MIHSTSVSVGRIMTSGLSHGFPVGEVIVTAGSTVKTVVANRAISSTPMTNSGSPAMASRIVWMTVSGRRRR